MEIGIVEQIDIITKMREAYLDYAMSVITARALPDVRDGLKPVQRRILYAMEDMDLRHDRPYKKSARIVGEVLGKYHPHGDDPVYEAMVRMAQDFSMRYVLVDGQGNFGSIDGDSAAAMRYTEARLAAIAEEMLADIDKETVDFVPNFDGSLQEPVVLPSRIPNLLLNGTSGIAVGMATNIPPHNLGELCGALTYLIDNYDQIDDVSVEELLKFLPGPDFPTGGIILGKEGIKAAYGTGRGHITVRSKVHTEDLKGGRSRIVVTELPYQVNKSSLIERIAELVRNRRIESISDLRDESDRQGMRIVIELKRGEEARSTLEQLFKETPMQGTFAVNMLALVDMTPRLLPLKRALQLFIEHRRQVITRRSRFELERAKMRAHILEGLKIALDHLDAVINTIRQSQTADTAMQNLMRKFKLSEMQARAILDMQLRRLAAMERRKIEEEYADVIRQIAYLEDLLANPRKVLFLIKEDMSDLKRAYGDARRTHIVEAELSQITDQDLIPDTDVLIVLTQNGHIACFPVDKCKAGRQANIGLAVGVRDAVILLEKASTKDNLLVFTNQGRAFQTQVHRLADLAQQSKGQLVTSLLALGDKERVTALLPVPSLDPGSYLTMVTRQGRIKRVATEEFAQVPTDGLMVMGLEGEDELGWVRVTQGNDEVVLVTKQGQAIRFREEEVRPMGRAAAGVWAIKLSERDAVAGIGLVRDGKELLILTERGYGKRSLLSEYPLQGRYGGGVRTLDATKLRDTGVVTAVQVVHRKGEVALISTSGEAIRVRTQDIPLLERSTWSTVVREEKRIMKLKDDEGAAAIAVLGGEEAESPLETEDKVKAARSVQQAAGVKSSRRQTDKAVVKGGKKPVSQKTRSGEQPAARQKPSALGTKPETKPASSTPGKEPALSKTQARSQTSARREPSAVRTKPDKKPVASTNGKETKSRKSRP